MPSSHSVFSPSIPLQRATEPSFSLPFVPSARRSTIGVEWELVFVDNDTRELAPHGPAVLEKLKDSYVQQGRAKAEIMQNTVEIVTGICQTVAQATEDLSQTALAVCDAADKKNASVIGAGTHPFSQWWSQEMCTSERFDALSQQYVSQLQRMQIYGVHVHFGLDNADSVIPLMHSVASYIAPLLALSCSSPYWVGHDTGLASVRSGIFEGMITGGLPPRLESWAEYEELVATLSAGDPRFDLRRCWWDVRPHPDFGTLEVRLFDCVSTLAELSGLVALVQCVVERAARQFQDGQLPDPHPEWLLRENKQRAARWGLDAPLTQYRPSGAPASIVARDLISELVQELAPIANDMGCSSELNGIFDILKNGTSSERQRVVAQRHGGDLKAVVDHLAAELRDSL